MNGLFRYLCVLGLLLVSCAEPNSPAVVHRAQKAVSTECSADAVDDPPAFQWTYHSNGDYFSGVLEVSEATFLIDGETLTTRAYRQPGQPHSIPGPTITMAPGNTYVLRFHNRLPYEPLSTSQNVLKDPNASNVHTHGLHISGESPGDDVTRTFPGGFGGDFVYEIPADHMGGTYWYHAHHHGSTFLQVSGGTFGLLIIDDGGDGMPQHVADMQERHIVLGYLDPGAAGSGGDTLMGGTLSPSWTLNGHTSGSLCIPANEWQHWRVLLADRDAKEKTVSFGAGCEVALLARDGVWRTEVPGAVSSNSLSLTGASRADFAVRCSADTTLSVGGNSLGTILVGPDGDPAVHPFGPDGVSAWPSIRPDYLRDLRGVPKNQLNTETVRMGARTVNGRKYDHHNANLTLPAEAVQEWSIKGAAQHPFHLHVYHFQTNGCGGDYEDGEFYDVLSANCPIRFDTNAATSSTYDGRTIMHCHVLEHEDQGAMGWLDLVGGTGPPTFPADTPNPPFGDYYALSSGPTCGDGTCDPGEDPCSCASDCGSPPSTELSCVDGHDEDCDGQSDCADSDCASDPACGPACGDGTCDPGEDPCSCASDCGSPPSTELSCVDGHDEDCDGQSDCADSDCASDPACGPACGDGTCDPGEDPCSCASDCGSPPSTELSCVDGHDEDCDGQSDCADSDCASDPACGPACGDGTCDPGEDPCSCASDCGSPPSTELSCVDGHDEDCDGQSDCADSDCASDPACGPPGCDNDGLCEVGEDCVTCANDCSSVTKGKPANRYCCGDGTQDSAEGDGSICDGHY